MKRATCLQRTAGRLELDVVGNDLLNGQVADLIDGGCGEHLNDVVEKGIGTEIRKPKPGCSLSANQLLFLSQVFSHEPILGKV